MCSKCGHRHVGPGPCRREVNRVDRRSPIRTRSPSCPGLYRAGRYNEALIRFEQLNRVSRLAVLDWLFLAMIQSRLGYASEARGMLETADGCIAESDKSPPETRASGVGQPQWQSVLERHVIRLVRSEAEAVILYDPIFPADPFAH